MANKHSQSEMASSVTEPEVVPSLRSLKARIDRLSFPADAKAILVDIAELTLTVGGKLLPIGRQILIAALDIARKFQNVIFGVIIAMVLSVVITAIPLLGPAISALLTPLMLAVGIAKGALEDFRNIGLQSEISMLKQRMEIIGNRMVP